ncbi:uncharacterized protein [Arachis hypogaea]|uniref:uncharacterized protein isoform X2 n=1 Tax=Arachis hypogaea TaxID=3818 RepID=UPI003B21D39B
MISSELEYYWISLSFLLLLACNCVITTLFLFLFSFLFLNYYFYLKLLLIMGFQKSLESKIGGICIYSALQRILFNPTLAASTLPWDSTTHASPSPAAPRCVDSSAGGSGGGGTTPSSEPLAKKHRGRPPGSGKKQMDALGAGGIGFTPHVILVESGEGRFEIIFAGFWNQRVCF